MKTVEIKNIGKHPLSFDIDLNSNKIAGLHLSFQKVHKMVSNSSQTLQITLKTKKTSKAGITVYQIPVIVHNGGKYLIELMANINIPDLRLSDSVVDF